MIGWTTSLVTQISLSHRLSPSDDLSPSPTSTLLLIESEANAASSSEITVAWPVTSLTRSSFCLRAASSSLNLKSDSGHPPGKSGTPYSRSNGVKSASPSGSTERERSGERRVGTEDEEEEREKRDVGDKSQDILVRLSFGLVLNIGGSVSRASRRSSRTLRLRSEDSQ